MCGGNGWVNVCSGGTSAKWTFVTQIQCGEWFEDVFVVVLFVRPLVLICIGPVECTSAIAGITTVENVPKGAVSFMLVFWLWPGLHLGPVYDCVFRNLDILRGHPFGVLLRCLFHLSWLRHHWQNLVGIRVENFIITFLEGIRVVVMFKEIFRKAINSLRRSIRSVRISSDPQIIGFLDELSQWWWK